jgi:hypothetical protein
MIRVEISIKKKSDCLTLDLGSWDHVVLIESRSAYPHTRCPDSLTTTGAGGREESILHGAVMEAKVYSEASSSVS